MTMIVRYAMMNAMDIHASHTAANLETGLTGSAELQEPSAQRAIIWLAAASFALFGLAGGLLWWRDGERLFTEGLISAIARCF